MLNPQVIAEAGPLEGIWRAVQIAELWGRLNRSSILSLRQPSDGDVFRLGGFEAHRSDLVLVLKSKDAPGWIDMIQEGRVLRRIQAPEVILTIAPSPQGDWPQVQMQITPTVKIADTPEHKRLNLRYQGLTAADPPELPPLESDRLLNWAAEYQGKPDPQSQRRSLLNAIQDTHWRIVLERWNRIGMIFTAGLAIVLAWTLTLRFTPRFMLLAGMLAFVAILAVELWIQGAGSMLYVVSLNLQWIGVTVLAAPLVAMLLSLELYRQKQKH